MAPTIGRLVRAVAAVEGLDEGSVKLIARYAREAGFIGQLSTGGGAARMDLDDAVNLLIAVNGSMLAKEAGEIIEPFGRSVCHSRQICLPHYSFLTEICSKGRQFGAALGMMMSSMSIIGRDGISDFEKEIARSLGVDAANDIYSKVQVGVTFKRPVVAAEIWVRAVEQRLSESGPLPSGNRELIRGYFGGVHNEDCEVDQQISKIITTKTLRAVSKLFE
ncbi:hypothetical protein [Methylobacterium nigriterrae]|uniref:hypothetical protein n=1 Tax=Methylobacterium nigriterrae TaxID=3127512 RepID=UPI00301327C7